MTNDQAPMTNEGRLALPIGHWDLVIGPFLPENGPVVRIVLPERTRCHAYKTELAAIQPSDAAGGHVCRVFAHGLGGSQAERGGRAAEGLPAHPRQARGEQF